MLPLGAAAAVSAALALYAWRRRPVPGAAPFAALMLAVAEWALAYALELGGLDLATIVLGLKTEYPGIVTVPVAFLALAIEYTGREKWLTRRNLALLAVLPLVTLLLAWSNEVHGLIWRHIELESAGPLLVPAFSRGAWYWVNVGYGYALLLLGILLLLQMLIRAPALYRRQAGVLLVGAMVPWASDMLWVSGLNPFAHLDPTPFAFTLSGLVVAWGLFRYRLLDIVPVARDAVIEGMQDGVIVLDAQNRIVDLNPAAERIIGHRAAEVIGQPFNPTDLGLRVADWDVQDGFQYEVQSSQSEMTFDLRISSQYDRHRRLTGRLITLHDITARREVEKTLRESSQFNQAIISSVREGIIIYDRQLRYVVWNSFMEDMTGLPAEHVLGKYAPDVFPHLREQGVVRLLQRALAGETVTSEDTPYYVSQTGKSGWVSGMYGPYRDANGDIIGVIGLVRDITERKQAEQTLHQRFEQLQAIYHLSEAVSRTEAIEEVYEEALDSLQRTLKADRAAVLLFDPDGVMRFKAWHALSESYREATEGHSPWEPDEKHPQPVLVPDVQQEPEMGALRDVILGEGIHALGFIPLVDQGRLLGKFMIYYNAPHQFKADEVQLAQTIAGHIAFAIERARAEAALRRRAEELAVLHETSLDITMPHNLPTLLHTIVERAARLLDAPSGSLFLCDPERQEVRCVVSYNTPRDYTGTVLKYGEGSAGIVAHTGEPLNIDDYRIWPGRAAAYEEEQPFTAVLSAPMIWQGQVTGVIHVLHDVEMRRFTQADLKLLTQFANQAAIAVESARLLEAEREQRAQAEARAAQLRDRERFVTLLNDITHTSVEALDFQTMLQTLADRLGELIDADGCYITLWDEARQMAIPAAAYGELRESYPLSPTEPGEVTMTESVLRAGHALVAEDVFNTPHLSPHIAAQYPARSLLGLPLIAGDQKLGAALIAFNQPHHFTPDEIARGEQAAAQIALAVAKARLFDAERHHAEQLSALHETALDITAHREMPDLLAAIVARAAGLLNVFSGGFYLVEPDGETLRLAAAHGFEQRWVGTRLRRGEGMAGRVLETGQPLIVEDYDHWEGRATVYDQGMWGSVLSVPVFDGEQVIGVLSCHDPPGVSCSFGPAAVALLERFARQAAIAITNARLLEETRRRSAHLEGLNAVIAAAVAARDLPTLLETALDRTLHALELKMGAIRVGDLSFVRNLPPAFGPILAQTARNAGLEPSTTIAVDDWSGTAVNGRWSPLIPVMARFSIRASLTVPILMEGERIGHLSLAGPESRTWSPEEVKLVEAVGRELGGAAERLRLFTATRERATRMRRLALLSEDLSRPLSMADVLQAIGQGAMALSSADRAALYVRNPDDAITCPWSQGLSPAYIEQVTARAREMPGGRLFDRAEPVLIPDVEETPGESLLCGLARIEGYRAAGLWPLVYEGWVLAAVGCYYDEAHIWLEAEQEAMEAFSRQAAVVLENARLFDEARRSAEELKAASDILRSLNAAPDVTEAFRDIVAGMRTISDCDRISLALLDDRREWATFIALDRPRAAPSAGPSTSSGGTSGGASGRAVRPAQDTELSQGTRLHISDTAAAEDVLAGRPHLTPDLAAEKGFLAERALYQVGLRSRISLPLQVGEQVIGALNIGWLRPAGYDETQLPLLGQIADAVALAVERSRLFDEARRRADQMAIVHALGQQITPLLDVDELLQTAAEALHARFGYLSVQLYLLDQDAGDPSTGSGQVLEARGVAGEEGLVVRGYRQPVGQGITGRVAERGELVLIGDVSQEPDFIPCVPGIRSELALPIRVAGEVAGVLNVESEQLHGFDEADVVALEALAGQIGAALENAQLYSAEQTRRKELDTLYGLSRQLLATDDLESAMNTIAHHVAEVVHVTFCRVLLLEEDGALICRAAHPVRVLERDLGVGRSDPVSAWPYYRHALDATEPQVLLQDAPTLSAAEQRALFLDLVQTLCLAPLRVGGRAIGLLVLGEACSVAREPFDADKLRLTAAIADQAASALHRAGLHTELEDAYVQTILALANAMDARDAYTAGHSQRLVNWAEAVARKLGCHEHEIESLHWATLLHDIGKIGVPDHILQKPGSLADDERAVIEHHPLIGERIVAPVKKLAHVASIIRSHQEHWDGTGYPDRLRGGTIPLAARILAVVDAYGAMTDDRVYRKAMSHEAAVAELRRCAGTQFDPQVVETFLEVIEKGTGETGNGMVRRLDG
jgi:PAS domain S-box-containing protein